MAGDAGISGLAVTLAATGGLLIWSGVNNTTIVDTLRSLAKGQSPEPNRPAPFQPVDPGTAAGASPGPGIIPFAETAQGSAIVAEAQKWLGTKYVFGGCHGCTPCHPKQGVDCSSFVTWVMKAVGAYHGKCSMVAGSSMVAWGKRIPNASRAAGDVVLWVGHHCGIVVDKDRMINAPHTGTVVRYDNYSHRTGWIVLRAPNIPSQTASGSITLGR